MESTKESRTASGADVGVNADDFDKNCGVGESVAIVLLDFTDKSGTRCLFHGRLPHDHPGILHAVVVRLLGRP